MASKSSISVEEVKALLSTPEVSRVETEIARRLGCQIIPHFNIMNVWEQLWVADVTFAEALECFKHCGDLLIALYLGINALPDECEEYPEGEEPDSRDLPETVELLNKMPNGFVVSLLCYFILAQRSDRSVFAKWLKRFRYPHAKKFESQVRKIIRNLSIP